MPLRGGLVAFRPVDADSCVVLRPRMFIRVLITPWTRHPQARPFRQLLLANGLTGMAVFPKVAHLKSIGENGSRNIERVHVEDHGDVLRQGGAGEGGLHVAGERNTVWQFFRANGPAYVSPPGRLAWMELCSVRNPAPQEKMRDTIFRLD